MAFIDSMLEDSVDGGVSSKRVITFLAFIFCTIAFFANLFFNYTIDANIFDGMMYIAIAGLGVTASEKFANARYRVPDQASVKQREPIYNRATQLPKQEEREI
jgi:hypothetical protein